MRAVRDPCDRLVVLVERTGEAVRVRDPASGSERGLARTDVDPVEGASRSPRELGLLLVLAASPRRIRELLDGWGFCESDINGVISELRAAGLVERRAVDGEPGYRLTTAGAAVVADHPGRD